MALCEKTKFGSPDEPCNRRLKSCTADSCSWRYGWMTIAKNYLGEVCSFVSISCAVSPRVFIRSISSGESCRPNFSSSASTRFRCCTESQFSMVAGEDAALRRAAGTPRMSLAMPRTSSNVFKPSPSLCIGQKLLTTKRTKKSQRIRRNLCGPQLPCRCCFRHVQLNPVRNGQRRALQIEHPESTCVTLLLLPKSVLPIEITRRSILL